MTSFLTSSGLAGKIVPQRLTCAADQIYVGMPLSYVGVATAAAVDGDGNGTTTLLSASKDVAVGAHVITFSAALVAEIVGPDNKRQALAIADGAAKAFNVNGLKFTITDGSTPFSAADVITITVSGSGAYAYDAVNPEVVAWEETLLSSEGRADCLVAGSEILKSQIVDDSGDALTITDSIQKNALSNGIVLRNV